MYNGRAIFYGEQTGFHSVKAGDDEFLIAANLANPEESQIEPPTELAVEGRQVQAGVGNLVFNRQEYWIFLVLAAMLLMFLEWLSYNRRWTV